MPAKGLGSSTTAFSVSTSTRTWLSSTVSPGATCQATISASVRPSPRSGSRNWRTSRHGCEAPVDLVEDAIGVGQEVALELGRRVRRGEAADPAHGRLEGVEAVLGDAGGDLGAEAAEDGRLVHDDQSSGLAHRRLERLEVDRRQRAQVDDLERDSLLRADSGGFQRGGHHGAVGGDGDVGALADDAGTVQRHGIERGVARRRRPSPSSGAWARRR